MYLKAIPSGETFHLLIIQIIFSISLLLTDNIINWAGIVFVEVARLQLLPKRLKEMDQEEIYKEEIAKMNEEFLSIRSQRHDFLSHINTIDYLLGQEANEEVKKYFSELIQDYNKVNVAIKGEEGHIAALLLNEYDKGIKAGINMDYNLHVPMSRLPLTAIDQVKLLSNLLDNAIDAAIEFYKDKGSATVLVETDLQSGIFILKVSNSAQFADKKLLDSLFQKFKITTKEGDHEGLGTYIITNLVNEYHGKLNYSYLNDTFTIIIKIPVIISNREKISQS